MKPEQRVPISLYGIRKTANDALGSLWRHRVFGSSSRTWRTEFRARRLLGGHEWRVARGSRVPPHPRIRACLLTLPRGLLEERQDGQD
jgi:hypothetical protein